MCYATNMEAKELLNIKSSEEFKAWLEKNHSAEKSCYLELKRGKPQNDGNFYYLDAVEIALCYGWIDSTLTKIDGKCAHKFTPRSKNSLWTELNKERVRRLEKLGLMTDAGRKVLPDMSLKPIEIPDDIKNALINENAFDNFNSFPELYKRIRIYNLNFYKKKLPNEYQKALANFIKHTKENKMYGLWNDYGRLIDY